jgi:hypothetical protein
LFSSDKNLQEKLSTLESLQEADPGNKMLYFMVKVTRRCIGGLWRIAKQLRPIARLNATLADTYCEGDRASSEDAGKTSNLRQFNLSALRLDYDGLVSKQAQSRQNLIDLKNLRNVNPARAADRELAEMYKLKVYTACRRRRLWPNRFSKWVELN